MATSVDGSRLAVGGQQSLRIYEVKTGKLLREYGGTFQWAEMKFSPAGDQLAVWSNYGTAVSLYAVDSGVKPRLLDGGLSSPTCVAFGPNAASLAAGYADGTTLLWNLAAK